MSEVKTDKSAERLATWTWRKRTFVVNVIGTFDVNTPDHCNTYARCRLVDGTNELIVPVSELVFA